MSIDHILNRTTTALTAGGDSVGSVTEDLSVGLGAGDPGRDGLGIDNGASPPSLGNDGSTGAVQLDLAAGATSVGVADNPATLRYYTGLSKPISISFLPQSPKSAGSDGSDGSSGAVAADPTVSLFDDFGGGFSQSGSASIDLFSKGGSGGGSSGGSGGTPPPQFTETLNGMTFVINWDKSVGSAPKGFVSGFESAVQYFLDNLGPATTPITITLDVGWGEVAGSRLSAFALGESSTNIDRTSYSALSATSMGSYLPASDPVSGAHTYWIPSAEEKALGLVTNNSNVDGSVGFSSRVSWNFNSTTGAGQYDFVSTAEHEISEVMGGLAWAAEPFPTTEPPLRTAIRRSTCSAIPPPANQRLRPAAPPISRSTAAPRAALPISPAFPRPISTPSPVATSATGRAAPATTPTTHSPAPAWPIIPARSTSW